MSALRRRITTCLIATTLSPVFAWHGTQSPDGIQGVDVQITRWEFRDDENWFGLITAAAQCGQKVFLADFQQKIRVVDLAEHRQLPFVTVEAPPMALAADCDRNILYVVSPNTRATRGLSVLAVQLPLGDVTRRYPLPTAFARGAQWAPPDLLYISGVVHPDVATVWKQESGAHFYAHARIGLVLSLTTGTVEPLLDPYEHECIGAGVCAEVYLAATRAGFVVGQPTSAKVGIYDTHRRLSRVIDVTSPKFQRTGQVLPVNTSAEARLRWQGENSTIGGVFQLGQYVATVHARPKIERDWVFGQPLNFSVLMNLHQTTGTLVRADLELPDLPLGHNDQGIFTIDYGEQGRVGASPQIRLSRFDIR